MTIASGPPAVRSADEADLAIIGQLARRTWAAAYADILEPEQIEYMLANFYDPAQLAARLRDGREALLLAPAAGEAVGFAGFGPVAPRVYKLHRLYVLPEAQRGGWGRALLEVAESRAAAHGALAMILNVNRHNGARAFYARNGYAVAREEDNPIGNGYWMNDYVMARSLDGRPGCDPALIPATVP